MTTYIFPPNGAVGKSQSLAVSNASFAYLPNFVGDSYFYEASLSGSLTGPITVSGLVGGTTSTAIDPSGTAFWGTGWYNQVYTDKEDLPPTVYNISSGSVFFNGATNVGGTIAFSTFSGDIYYIPDGTLTKLLPLASGSVGLQYSDSTSIAYSLNPTSSALLSLNGSTVAVSSTSIPVPNLIQAKNFSVSASGTVAVVGTYQGSLATIPASSVFEAPDGDFAAYVNPSNNTINLLQGPDPNWTPINSFSASGTAEQCCWNQLSTQVLTTNSQDFLSFYAVAGSALSLFQTLSIPNTGATQIVSVPATTQAVYCNPTNNYIEFINFSGSWSLLQQVAVTSPTCVFAISSTEIVVGVGSGIAVFSFSSNTWSQLYSVPLSFTPAAITADSNGNIYAAGVSGGNGSLVAINSQSVVSTVSWIGGAEAVLYSSNQIFVSDSTDGAVRGFSFINPSLTLQETINLPFEVTQFVSTGTSILAIGGGSLRQLRLNQPFSMALVPFGFCIVYDGASWGSPSLFTQPFGIPAAAVWNPDGNVNVATTTNILYEVNGTSVVSQSNITNYEGIIYNQPIGISSLTWAPDGHLYASTSMNSAMLRIL